MIEINRSKELQHVFAIIETNKTGRRSNTHVDHDILHNCTIQGQTEIKTCDQVCRQKFILSHKIKKKNQPKF